MGSIHQVPPRARMIDQIRKVIPEGGRKGQTYWATRHRIPAGYSDSGTEYLAMRVGRIKTPERIARSWRYSGERLALAESDWQAWTDDTRDWPDLET